jgi:hypothetical protein
MRYLCLLILLPLVILAEDKKELSEKLTLSVYSEKFNEVEKLLKANPKQINYRDVNDRSLLFYAQTPQMLKYLIKKGIDLTAVDKDGNTVIHESTIKSKAFVKELVFILINKHMTPDDHAKLKDFIKVLTHGDWKERRAAKKEATVFPAYLKLYIYFNLSNHQELEVRYYAREIERVAPKFLSQHRHVRHI